MKKLFILVLIILCLSFNITKVAFSENVFKQGVYTLSDLNRVSDNLYQVKNVSSKENAYVALFDEENIILQTIRLPSNSASYNLLPLKSDYKIVLLGKGEVYISPVKSK
ncbi:hypothetical protein NNC19_03015 [Clostridium sp. SHJSY1]|uniref:hypothetical protein n=1 Tax=Clostridium sp. SHJSY1 TaxID=2942483 RepID=UPI002876F280|nr:hypothetical protein [Clostridium sp. SHJSY1]MDS0524634.1 hypothetical protein [Clostridium sp. SHJSY1]